MRDITVPAVGESITEATIGEWLKKDGDYVQRDEPFLLLETDKASVEVVAEVAGLLKISAEEGDTVDIGATVGQIDTSAEAPSGGGKDSGEAAPEKAAEGSDSSSGAAPSQDSGRPAPDAMHLSPAVQRVVNETGVNPANIKGTGPGGRITKEDAVQASKSANQSGSASPAPAPKEAPAKPAPQKGTTERKKMSSIRKKIAQRLVEAQQTAAILTTFNEVDMTNLMALRTQYKEAFEKKHGVRMGFMGFFVKAAIQALRETPEVNAYIDGDEIVYNNFMNVGIAVSSPRGLVVPVLKNAEDMSLADVEGNIRKAALKARDGKITIDDMSGGTFTISNGGVFGSLMSTPILNPPQSAILGMHKIEKRAVVVDDQIVIRPMMYLALSYDHRMIDGSQSVGFLVRIKECIEDPSRMLMEV